MNLTSKPNAASNAFGSAPQRFLDQLTAVDKQRLIKKLGSLDNDTQTAISNKLVAMFSL